MANKYTAANVNNGLMAAVDVIFLLRRSIPHDKLLLLLNGQKASNIMGSRSKRETLGRLIISTLFLGAAALAWAQDDLVSAEGVVIEQAITADQAQKQSLVFANNRGRLEVVDGVNKGDVSLLDFASQKAFAIDNKAKQTLLRDFPGRSGARANSEPVSYKPEGAVITVAGLSAAKFSLEVNGVQCATVYTSLELSTLPAYTKYLSEYLGAIPTPSDSSLNQAELDACAAAATVPVLSMSEFGAPVMVENAKGEAIYKVAALIPSGMVPVTLFGLPDFPVKVMHANAE